MLLVFSGTTQKTFGFLAALSKQESFLRLRVMWEGKLISYHILHFIAFTLPLLRGSVRSEQKTSLLWTAYNSTSLLAYGKVCQCRKLEFRVLSEACPIEASSVNHIWQPFVKGLSPLALCMGSPHHTHHCWTLCWFLHVTISWGLPALTNLILIALL